MLDKNLMIIGGGNMGSALLKGILKAKLTSPSRITVVDVHPGKIEELRKTYKVTRRATPSGPRRRRRSSSSP